MRVRERERRVGPQTEQRNPRLAGDSAADTYVQGLQAVECDRCCFAALVQWFDLRFAENSHHRGARQYAAGAVELEQSDCDADERPGAGDGGH